MTNKRNAYPFLEDRIVAYGLTIIFYVIFLFFYGYRFPVDLPSELFGHKTVAIFDLWSIQHLLTGIVLGRIVCFMACDKKETQRPHETYCAFIWLVIFWEFAEINMETGNFGLNVLHWKDGVEHWTNRFISDPLIMILGLYIYRKYRKYFWLALLFSTIWLIVNVFMPNCNTIQNFISIS